jgi:hypothetical protein
MPLLLLGAVGCVPLFYAYPTLSYTPAIAFGPDHKGIYAFRVDVTDDTGGAGKYRLRNLPITRKGYLNGQGKSAVDDGYYWNCLVHTYARQISHTLRVRLYRPGYELVEIQSWHTNQAVHWQEVEGVEAREKAVDDLLCTTEGTVKAGKEAELFAHLEPGSAAEEHREVLFFASREYERLSLAAADAEAAEVSDRCAAKAKILKKLAAE